MKLNLQTYTVDPMAAHEVIVMPQFGDVIDENGEVVIPSSETGDWTVLDDVPYGRPLIQIFGKKNLLKRRDATCKLIRSSFGTASAKEIFTRKLYLAAENCENELYQGAFKDWESRTDIFQEKALELIGEAVGTDMFSNKWFGNDNRANNANWSLNKFNGIFYWYNKALTDGVIPAGQSLAIPQAVNISEVDAYDLILAMIDAQDYVLQNIDESDKAIYIDKNLAKKVWRYLVSVGYAPPQAKADNMPANFYVEDIELRVKKWAPLLSELNGSPFTYAAILTIKQNFVFATDKAYGKGPKNSGPALSVWYDAHDDTTKWDFHLKGGTQVIAPQFSVIALSGGLTAVL
jgi:hypothetical protein